MSTIQRVLCLFIVLIGVQGHSNHQTPQNFKVAFIGDQGVSRASRQVLGLIKREGAQLIIHQGDFDYIDSPAAWERQVNLILGEDFPYIASAGNHDAEKWFDADGYRERLNRRAARVPGMNCTGDHGVNGVCVYKGLLVATSGVGSIGHRTYEYLEGILAQSEPFIWKICSWHKQQKSYQVGSKDSDVPWKYYSLCREHGAIIAQGHEHSYSRTYTMTNFENHQVADRSETVTLGPGLSFAFTNGLGGVTIRRQTICRNPGECPYWASVYTRSQNAKPGVLFCSFNVGGDPRKGHCYFRNTQGEKIDEFKLTSLNALERQPASLGAYQSPTSLWFPTEISQKSDVWNHSQDDKHQCL